MWLFPLSLRLFVLFRRLKIAVLAIFLYICKLINSAQYIYNIFAMKLEQLKQEITQLAVLVDGWQQSGCAVEIERDLALEKVRKIYNTLRFEVEVSPQQEAATTLSDVAASILTSTVVESKESEPENEAAEPDFEIEFIMPEEGESELAADEESEDDEELYEDEDDEEESDNEYEEDDQEDDEEGDYNDGDEEIEPIVESAVEPQAESELEIEPIPASVVEPEPQPAPAPQSQPQLGFEQSLFDMEAAPRTTPRRRSLLMSLYDDAPQVGNLTENRTEQAAATPAKSSAKPLDTGFGKRNPNSYTKSAMPLATTQTTHTTYETVSAEPAETTNKTPQAAQNEVIETPKAAPRSVIHVQEPVIATLADTDVEAVLGEILMPERQTLGDTISPTQTVAESAPVKSLRSAISVADRFMLARTLFGGDDAAFDRAIEELDSFDDFDNCIIHITENYPWPPASEGAKMIIELLQRKFL